MKQYIVDAFTSRLFSGNPAAVCVSDQWLSAEQMQNIAIENSLSETAFAVPKGDTYQLRWFTPGGEINLCGHATLATAYVITRLLQPTLQQVAFSTKSGVLTVRRNGELLEMDFPSFPLTPKPELQEQITQAIGIAPQEIYIGEDLVCVLRDEKQVRSLLPDLAAVEKLEVPCLHITAPGEQHDCVTRTFAPRCGVAEDPVCGRGHCHVVPLWAEKLEKNQLTAWQASRRGGLLYCRQEGQRTVLSGNAVLFAQSELYL